VQSKPGDTVFRVRLPAAGIDPAHAPVEPTAG
jgi:hypothetical protein